MNIKPLLRKAKYVARQKSPVIFAVAAITGTVTTAVLAVRAGMKAEEALSAHPEVFEDLTPRDKFVAQTKMTWKFYIPVAVAAVGTVGSVAAGSRISVQRTAAITGALAVSERAFGEYKDRVVQNIGEKKEQKVRDDIAQDRITANPVSTSPIVFIDSGKALMFDKYTSRYFEKSMEDINRAVNAVNFQLAHEGYCSLNEWYDRLGIEGVPVGEEIGWNSDQLLELRPSSTIADDGRAALVIDFNYGPHHGFTRLHG